MDTQIKEKKNKPKKPHKTKQGKDFNIDIHHLDSSNDPMVFDEAYDINLNIPLATNPSGYRNIPLYKDKGNGYDSLLPGFYQVFKKALQDSINSQQKTLAISTVHTYYMTGLRGFFGYLQVLSSALGRGITWQDINRNTIDQFIRYLAQNDTAIGNQKNAYTHVKSILKLCFNAGLIDHIDDVNILFPKNPYPNSNRLLKGQSPYSKVEFKRLVKAVRIEYKKILESNKPLTAYEESICVFALAIRTGINQTPVLELPIDCLQPHPLKEDSMILVSFKRRGKNTHITALRKSEEVAALKAIKFDIVDLIQLVVERNQVLRDQYLDQSRLFVYSSTSFMSKGEITALSKAQLARSSSALVDKHKLTDDDGNPLVLNLSKIRKTFANRMFDLSGGDPLVAAKHGHHSIRTANNHYWTPPPEAEANHRQMIEGRALQLIATDLKGGEEPTPIAMCADTKYGQRAPKDGSHCTEILACFRCKSFVVTKDDLHRLFSFYWTLIEDRKTTDSKSWAKHFRHIRQIIDDNITPQFNDKFNAEEVEKIKQNAKVNRHSYWKNLTMLRMSK